MQDLGRVEAEEEAAYVLRMEERWGLMASRSISSCGLVAT